MEHSGKLCLRVHGYYYLLFLTFFHIVVHQHDVNSQVLTSLAKFAMRTGIKNRWQTNWAVLIQIFQIKFFCK